MTIKTLLIVLAVFGGGVLTASSTFGDDDAAPWTALFNGKDLTGWTLKGGGGKAYVQDGEIVCHVTANTREHTFICTNDTFGDFVLEMDMKIDGDFNTGIVLRGVDALPAAPVRIWGYMVKVDPTPRKWTGGIFEDFGQVWQWLSTLANDARAREAFKINEWNRFRIEAIGPHIKVWINGIPTANLIDSRYEKGCIALKIHWTGNFPEREKILAHFKNIRVITDNPEHYTRATDIPPVRTVNDSGIRVPAGFRALLVADDLVGGTKRPGDRMQFLAVTPAGAIFAKTSKGGIIAMQRRSGDSRADAIEEFGSGGGSGGTGIAVHEGSLYYSTASAIYRYHLAPGKLVPQQEPEIIVKELPVEDGDESKAFAFDGEGHLMVEVGNSRAHGGFWKFDANKPDQLFTDGTRYATGVYRAISLAWHPISKTFFTVMQGRDDLASAGSDNYDLLDNNRPADELHRLDEGADLGWPATYFDPFKRARMLAPEAGGDNRKHAEPGKYHDPLLAFAGHGRPMQMVIYNARQFPQKYRGGAFIAFNGSANSSPLPPGGCNVCFVPFDEKGMPSGGCEVFADGFAGTGPGADAQPKYRPCGLAIAPDGTLYISDSEHGRVWRIICTDQPEGM